MNIYFVSTAQEPVFGLFVIATTRGRAKTAGAIEFDENYLDIRTRLCKKDVDYTPPPLCPPNWWHIIYEEDYETLAKYGLRYATEDEIEAAGY